MQDLLPPAPPSPPAPPVPPGAQEDPPNDGSLPDLSRLYLLYLSKPTQGRLDELLKRCLKFLEKRIDYWVYVRDYCPPGLVPKLFSEDAFDRACDKFRSKIHALRSPRLFDRWLKKVAFSCVGDEFRKVTGREKGGPRHRGPLEVKHPDGTVTHVLDRAENRDAAERYCCVTIQQTQFVEQLFYREILGKSFNHAIGNCSKRQREGIEYVKLMAEYDLTADEIAAERGIRKSIVQNRIRAGKQKLRQVAETKYKFSAEDL